MLIYTSVGIGWILLSDRIAASQVTNLHHFELIANLKGILFIITTAGLLYLLIRYYAGQLRTSLNTCQLAEQEAKKLAHFDSETGLPNYNLLVDRLHQIIALNARKRANTAVIYISLTGFKAVVDARGHNGGSEAVRGIAERLVLMVRQYDTVARIHRDEFALVLGGTVVEGDVAFIVNKLQTAFSEPFRLEHEEVMIPACFGVACFPTDGLTSELLLQRAHIAMNQARMNGVTCQYYSETLNQKAAERLSTEIGLLHAMDEGEFFLCYQPKMGINGKNIIGMEALVRWRRSGQDTVLPEKFIHVAEENGLIVRLGAYVIQEACRQNRAWQEDGLPRLRVAVNISARQLRDNDFVALVIRILEETGLEPGYLELELTESALMNDAADAACKLLHLRDLGVSISVDDFGTGYSSLSYLKHLPIDTIKIDRSFVRDIASDPDDAAIVDAIVAMAHSLNLNVIAEGVETHEQLKFLRECNCQQVQGYYFARPLEPQQFAAFMVQHTLSSELSASTPDELPDATVSMLTSPNKEPPGPNNENIQATASGAAEYIGDIAIPVVPVHPGDNLAFVLRRFQVQPDLLVLPVVEDGYPVGFVNRSTFLEKYVIGLHGYAFHIYHAKKMRDLMASVRLVFEATVKIKEVAQAIQAQQLDFRVDNICVIRDGLYHGVVDINHFINAITEINLVLAKGANPLTGLPGNESIQREIIERLQTREGFDIAYVDIDNFKPYNDHYGFQRGDVVIKTVGDIITGVIRAADSEPYCFCGHIGGDDFIVITEPHQGEDIASLIITAFEKQLPVFHGTKEYSVGCYSALNRKGELENYGLLSMSIGIVDTLLTPVASYAQLASIASEVKKAAKKVRGSSVIINRRAVHAHEVTQ